MLNAKSLHLESHGDHLCCQLGEGCVVSSPPPNATQKGWEDTKMVCYIREVCKCQLVSDPLILSGMLSVLIWPSFTVHKSTWGQSRAARRHQAKLLLSLAVRVKQRAHASIKSNKELCMWATGKQLLTFGYNRTEQWETWMSDYLDWWSPLCPAYPLSHGSSFIHNSLHADGSTLLPNNCLHRLPLD